MAVSKFITVSAECTNANQFKDKQIFSFQIEKSASKPQSSLNGNLNITVDSTDPMYKSVVAGEKVDIVIQSKT